jgi:hypothetical protein
MTPYEDAIAEDATWTCYSDSYWWGSSHAMHDADLVDLVLKVVTRFSAGELKS